MKYFNIKVSAKVSTDFYLEVPDDANEEQIKELAKKEVILPHNYPLVIDNILKTRMGIYVPGIDSMLKAWIVDNVEYNIETFNNESSNN